MATELSIVYSAYGTCAYPVTIANRKKQKKKKKKKKKNAQEWMDLYAVGREKR